MDFTNILDLAVKLLVALLAAFLVPWLRGRYGAEKLADIMTYVDIFTRAAEQMFDAAEGDKKKRWVLERLAEKGIKIDGTALDAMVEAAVNELHQALVQPQRVNGNAE